MAIVGGEIWTLPSTLTPALNLARASEKLLLSWTVPWLDFKLQQNSDLTSTSWTDVTNTPTLNLTNLHYEVALPLSSGNRFYRLKH